MTRVGKGEYIEKSEAIRILKKYPKNPLILAKVSINTWKYVDQRLKIVYFSRWKGAKLNV